jgi:uncharacterized membrane protein
MFQFSFLLSAIILVVLDSVYLNIMKGYMSNQVQKVQNASIQLNYVSAIICYVFLVTGLNYFIIKPNRSVQDAFLLGIVIYGVYETTNWAIFKNWSALTVIIDTLWGGILLALTTWIVRFFKKL